MKTNLKEFFICVLFFPWLCHILYILFFFPFLFKGIKYIIKAKPKTTKECDLPGETLYIIYMATPGTKKIILMK